MILSILVVIITIVLVLIFSGILPNNSKVDSSKLESEDSFNEFLYCNNKSEIEQLLKKGEFTSGLEENIYYINSVSMLNGTADVEITLEEDIVKGIRSYFLLFVSENITEETTVYEFSDKEIEQIEESFKKIKTAFEKFVDCGEIKQFDSVPAHVAQDGETVPEEIEEQFYQGFIIKEYSVLDATGVLWILRFEASNGSASAILNKIVDQTEYEGFLPIIDLYSTDS